ncbi:MAG TPA: 3-deoxy-7-phosphoheptulonate synthase [Kiritimatiellia bacterium]|nr:3-deoxy-7-phosphoheptulonate synthase [Kiritimatiellia bacterium]
MTERTELHVENLRVAAAQALVSPRQIKESIPAGERLRARVAESRETVSRILAGEDPRFLAVVGPCSIHDPVSAVDYGQRLIKLREQISDELFVVMRVYFEKPRTTVGWKGLINDPDLDDSCDIVKGLQTARKLIVDLGEMGLPVATEFLDPIVPQYLGDLITWAAIGARTTESQTHREMASGLSMPVGFKNGTDGRIQTAVDALMSASRSHSFLGIDQDGRTSVIKTLGNSDCHIVLRGGIQGPNYQAEQIQASLSLLQKHSLSPRVMIDCSHANSNKDPRKQVEVWKDILSQREAGCRGIMGAMLESHLESGNQPLPADVSTLQYGVSITDACLGWEETEALLLAAAATLRGSSPSRTLSTHG